MQSFQAILRWVGAGVISVLIGANPDTLIGQQRRVDTQGPSVPETASEPKGFVAEPDLV
jgi:hypothetical protein